MVKIRSALLFLFFFNNTSTCLQAQQYVSWANAGSDGGGGVAANTELDAAGNVYHSGTFTGSIDADPGTGVFNLSSNGGTDFYLIKYNAAGIFQWAISLGGTSDDNIGRIAVDPAGNTILSGTFTGFIDFDPGTGVYNLASQAADIFIIKLNTNGDFQWVKQAGGSLDEQATNSFLDINGNIYVTGTFFSPFVDFDPGTGVFILSRGGNYDGYILKLDTNGDFVWARQFKSAVESSNTGLAVSVDASGNVLVTGIFFGTVDFNTGAGVQNFTAPGFSSDGFLAKLDVAGNFIWAKHIVSSPGFDLGRVVTVDASGNIYVTGRFESTVDFDPGPGFVNLTAEGFDDAFITKYTPAGNLTWAKALSGPGQCSSIDICLDPSGANLSIAGFSYSGVCDLDPGPGTYLFDSGIGAIGFICKLSGDGNFVWAGIFNGTNTYCYSIVVKDGCDMYISGIFNNSIDVEPGSNTYLLSAAGFGSFVAKLALQYWSGSVSTDWHNPLNWQCNVVPGVQSNVIISAGAPRYPILSANTEIKSLYMQTSASVQVQPGVEMKVNGSSN